jgi:hypothetical protein
MPIYNETWEEGGIKKFLKNVKKREIQYKKDKNHLEFQKELKI